MIFHDLKDEKIYYTTNRLGSSLLLDISERDNKFVLINPSDLPKIVAKNNRKTEIIFPFREPIARFKSGLSVNLYNRTDFTKKILDYESALNNSLILDQYRYMLMILDNTAADNSHFLAANYKRPYHLYDMHTDHWLYMPMLFMVYNYNVKLLPLYELSKHLAARFPNCIDLIQKRERKNSFNETDPLYENIWKIYKEVFIDRIPINYENVTREDNRGKTWQEWMDPEIEIFNTFVKYLNTPNLTYAAHKLANKFLDKLIYFDDPFSTISWNIHNTIRDIQRYNPINPRFNYYFKNFQNMMSGAYNIQFQETRNYLG